MLYEANQLVTVATVAVENSSRRRSLFAAVSATLLPSSLLLGNALSGLVLCIVVGECSTDSSVRWQRFEIKLSAAKREDSDEETVAS